MNHILNLKKQMPNPISKLSSNQEVKSELLKIKSNALHSKQAM